MRMKSRLSLLAAVGVALLAGDASAQAVQCTGSASAQSQVIAYSRAKGACKARCPAGMTVIVGCTSVANSCAGANCAVTCTCR